MNNSSLAKIRHEYCLALDRSLKTVLQRLKGMPEVERVILFGSYANGRRDLFTDLDLLIVMASDQDFITRTADLYRMLNVRVDLDLLVYTPEELERQKEGSFVDHILRTGKVVYEKEPAGRG
jgi:predicted nucleotidyltransferase